MSTSRTEPGRPRAAAPRSWQDPEKHLLTVLSDPWYRGLLSLQDTLTAATVDFWSRRGVKNAHLPITTGAVSSPMGLGSDSTAVQIDLQGVPTYLADSMQFGLEFATRINDQGSYYVMPSFRGEPCDATHLSQFVHSEAEIPGGLDDVMVLVEDYLRFLTGQMLQDNADFIETCAGSTGHLLELVKDDASFVRLTFDEAVDAVRDRPGSIHTAPDGSWRSLTRAGEQYLQSALGSFLWITHWDSLAVPFYQATENGRALNADLLFGIGETVGAGERHVTGAQVRKALALHEVPAHEYEWYLTMKDLAPLRTAGFGMGVERYFLWLLQHDDIRDLQLMLRANGQNLHP